MTDPFPFSPHIKKKGNARLHVTMIDDKTGDTFTIVCDPDDDESRDDTFEATTLEWKGGGSRHSSPIVVSEERGPIHRIAQLPVFPNHRPVSFLWVPSPFGFEEFR